MAKRGKRTAIAAIVAFVALWPALQRGLVVAHHVDPWELFGWAMYAVPTERVQVGVELERDGQRERLRPNSAEFERIQRFARRRAALGSLASSEAIARAGLAAHPEAESVVVLTRRLALDPATARLVEHDREERFERVY